MCLGKFLLPLVPARIHVGHFTTWMRSLLTLPTPCVALLKVAAPVLTERCALARLLELRHDAQWSLRSKDANPALAISFPEDGEGRKKMFGAIPFNALRESGDQPGEISSW
jgi:hypothetical protein